MHRLLRLTGQYAEDLHVGGSGAGNSKYGGLWFDGKKFSYNHGK